MAAIHLQLVVPFHQPLSATELDLERACDTCYVPLIEQLGANSSACVAMHFTGHILDYLSRRRQEVLLRIKGMVKAGQVELLGGLFYGSVPSLLSELDVRGQIEMMAEYWESFVGTVPQGMWLPELAWCRELPRLLDETGFEYAFVSRSQIVREAGISDLAPVGVIERGGHRVAAFVLDPALSLDLPSKSVDEWVEAVINRARGEEALISVWVRAESLGLEPGTARWCFESGWLGQLVDVLGGGRAEVASVLPRASLRTWRPAPRLRLGDGIAPELAPEIGRVGQPAFSDFTIEVPEVRGAYQRMLRISDKLRDAITTMEEESLEEEWSDVLATAQRLVFAAQSPDVYWRGALPGFSDPTLRDAVIERLAHAESMVDTLIQGEDDWIAAEEEDRDGDLVEEIFVSNRRIGVWLVPADGGAIRGLVDRQQARCVLDVANRRAERFFASMAQAPSVDESPEPDSPPRRGEGLRRLSSGLPTAIDEALRAGIREHLLDADAAIGEFGAGTLTSGAVSSPADVVANQIDEEDGTYHFECRVTHEHSGVRSRRAAVTKRISVPIDASELFLELAIALEGDSGAIVGIEIPLRLGAGPTRLMINEATADLVEAEHTGVARLRLDGAQTALDLRLDPALDVWVVPVRTTIRDLAGFRAVDQGFLVVPLARVEQEATVTVKLALVPPVA